LLDPLKTEGEGVPKQAGAFLGRNSRGLVTRGLLDWKGQKGLTDFSFFDENDREAVEGNHGSAVNPVRSKTARGAAMPLLLPAAEKITRLLLRFP